ncbi:hypothetical protein, partial [Steroidobacter cummioxidans]|uniref:hypothetical protein n=1 Tax=Steroidobacter cummioxidans TaxID=1803913 RepID=UPI0012903852
MDFGRRVHFVCLFLSSLLFQSLAFGSSILPASKSDWIYFDKYIPSLGCFSSDTEAAQARIDYDDAGSTYVVQREVFFRMDDGVA